MLIFIDMVLNLNRLYIIVIPIHDSLFCLHYPRRNQKQIVIKKKTLKCVGYLWKIYKERNYKKRIKSKRKRQVLFTLLPHLSI